MKWYIHIGTGKTGSSAIQGVLNYNRHILLSAHRLLYPNPDAERFQEGVCHNHSAFLLHSPPEEQIRKTLAFLDYAEANHLRGLVFSSETPNPVYPELVSRILALRKNVDPVLIVYLRRQDHLLEASWKEWGTKRGHTDFQHFTDMHFPPSPEGQRIVSGNHYDFLSLLERWKTILPANCLIIRPYESEQLRNQDVVDDFLSLLGIEGREGFLTPPDSKKNRNSGVDASLVELMRLSWGLASSKLDHWMKELVYDACGPEARKHPFQPYPFLSPKVRLEILNASESTNQRIARDEMGREDGRLFHEPWPSAEDPWTPPAVPEDILCGRIAQILIYIQQQRRTLQKQLHAHLSMNPSFGKQH